MTAHEPPVSVEQARTLSAELLAELPERWRHSTGVADRAREVAATVEPADRPVLVAAAWLHDIGYAAAARDSGYHPLDGARSLDRLGWPPRISALVAHHSGAIYVARVRGLGDQLSRYPREQSPVTDALIYADQTVGPDGRHMTMEQRMADMLARHGPHSANAHAHPHRRPYLLQAVHRVEQRLSTL